MADNNKNAPIEVEVGPGFKPPESTETQPLSSASDVVIEEEGEVHEPPERWWTEIEDEEALKAHERTKPWLEETQDKARREIHSRLQPLINQRNTYLSQLAKTGERAQRDFERAQKEGVLDSEVLDKYEETASRISGAYWHLGRFDGAKAFVLELGQSLGDEELVKDFSPRIEILEQGGQDEKLFPDLLKRLAKAAGEKEGEAIEKKGYDKGVADGRKAALEELRARQREGQGPDLTRKQGAGGGVLTLDRYKSMGHDERAKLAPADIDRMTAELARLSR